MGDLTDHPPNVYYSWVMYGSHYAPPAHTSLRCRVKKCLNVQI